MIFAGKSKRENNIMRKLEVKKIRKAKNCVTKIVALHSVLILSLYNILVSINISGLFKIQAPYVALN